MKTSFVNLIGKIPTKKSEEAKKITRLANRQSTTYKNLRKPGPVTVLFKS